MLIANAVIILVSNKILDYLKLMTCVSLVSAPKLEITPKMAKKVYCKTDLKLKN